MDTPQLLPERSIKDIISLIEEVTEACSTEFYEWKKQYVADCIKEIRVEAQTSIDGALPPDTPISRHQDTKSFEDDFDPSTFMYTMDIWHFPAAEDSPSRSIHSTTLSVETFRHQVTTDFLQPVPPYEACVPIDRNITYDNAPGDKAILKFIPFADDDDFVTDETGLREFLEKNEGVEEWAYAWELPGRDPDADMVEREVVWRLINEHGLTFEELKQVGNFSPHFLEQDGGIPDIAKKRALLPWPVKDVASAHPLPPPSREIMMSKSLQRQCERFCANPTCIHQLCETHGDSAQSVPPKKPHRDIQHYKSLSTEPCDNNCFQNPQTVQMSKWTAIDIQDLVELLDTTSEIGICDMAFLLQKSCRETFSQLCALPSVKTHDNDESDSSSESSGGVLIIGPRKKLKKKKFPDDFMDRRTLQFEYIKPCNHPGECSSETKCECFSDNVLCKRSCLCDQKCVRRYRGCNSTCRRAFEGPMCTSASCRCIKYNRECDPEVCTSCRHKSGDDRCCNSNYSKGNFKLLRVVSKTYPWGPGWGVEAAEEIKKHEFISEYVGEIVSAPEVGHRFPQDKWINRVYNFTLDSTRTIDSARAGNETRFINHDDGEKVNCAARAISVNGDVRVGFYASKDIQIGEELFFNYGPGFFSEAE